MVKFEIEFEDCEGFLDYYNFCSWMIVEVFWCMVLFDEEGGMFVFVLFDSCVFELDASSLMLFNIYWMFVNCAYMDCVGMGGEFEINFWMVYIWFGFELINLWVNCICK